jgi:predicted adenine nucleotide alpha hydrolase (AANH) superfamily ATPase
LDELSQGSQVQVVYFNPNIHPLEEYQRRLTTLLEHARGIGIEVVELGYEPDRWHDSVGPFAQDPKRRCAQCYRLRLEEVARWAADSGCDALSTTLTVSPYQDPDAIAREGHRAAAKAGIEFVATDFRSRYADATRRSRELGMYRQNYCGCFISEAEALAHRRSRKSARTRELG